MTGALLLLPSRPTCLGLAGRDGAHIMYNYITWKEKKRMQIRVPERYSLFDQCSGSVLHMRGAGGGEHSAACAALLSFCGRRLIYL